MSRAVRGWCPAKPRRRIAFKDGPITPRSHFENTAAVLPHRALVAN
jgi:hypothetical protein